MIQAIPWKRVLQIGTLCILFAGAVYVGRSLPQPTLNAQAAAPAQVSPDGPPTLQSIIFTCNTPILNVGVFNSPAPGRVHVHCSNSIVDDGQTITYWAVKGDDSATASRFLSIFNTALATGRTLTLYYNSKDNGSAWGCNYNDCRPIVGVTTP
jgi:hypothetical protein